MIKVSDWTVLIRTSLPEVCKTKLDLKMEAYSFETFEGARDKAREVLNRITTVKNSMFDEDGNLTELKNHFNDHFGEFGDDPLKQVAFDILEIIKQICRGKDTVPPDWLYETDAFGSCYYDGIINVKPVLPDGFIVTRDEYGDGDPLITTNMISMIKEKEYFLCINDMFGYNDYSSELYLNIIKNK